MTLEEKVKQLVAESLHRNESEVTLEADFINDLQADSLDTAELVMAIEDAWILAACLDAIPDQPTALAQYQALRQPRVSRGDVAKQFQAKNAVHRVGRQADGKCRPLERLDPPQKGRAIVALGMIKHGLGKVRGQDHAIAVLGQHRPEASRPTGQVQQQAGLPRDFQSLAHQALVAP